MTDVASGLQQSAATKRRAVGTNSMAEGAPELIAGNGNGVRRESDVRRGGGRRVQDEIDNYDDEEGDDGSLNESKGAATGVSPRYEAYLMTGDKMLRLNSKLSVNYAKMKQAELPKHMEVLDSPPAMPRGPFSDLDNAADAFGAQQHRKSKRRQQNQNDQNGMPMPPSQSENGLASTSSSSSTATAASILATVSNEQQQQQPQTLLDNGCREPSLVTVHGFNHGHGGYKKTNSLGGQGASSDTDLGDDSRSTLQSADLPSHAATGADMPSPTSPSYYSEPVSPARFAFVGGQVMGSESPNSKRFLQQEHFRVPRQNGDSTSPSSVIRAQHQQQYLHCRIDEMSSRGGGGGESPRQQHSNGNTLIINVSQQMTNANSETAPTSVVVTGAASDSDSPGGSLHSTPLKERIQRFEAASRSSSSSTTAAKELDAEAANRLAKRLYTLEGFRRSDVAKHLVKNNEFSNLVALEYLKQFHFAGLRIDAAVRKFLHHFTLTGETSEREKIITYFSKRYYECNPGLFSYEDEVHTLTCALLLLNTDLHSQNVPKKMSCHDFIENISQAGYTFPRDLLRALYQSIKSHPIEWARDRSESETSASAVSGHGGGACDNRFLEMPDPDSQVEYKKGWVMRKCVIDEDGKPMPFGRRSWRMFYATLKGMVLYLHKDEHGFKKSSYQTFRNAVRIHHALASRAMDYIKKQHVFRLHTAGLAEYLFQTSDPKEMQSWIDSINFVAACFSAPVLPPAVSARQSFHRPLLPSSPTKLSMREQCNAHESRVKDVERMLEQHRYAAPGRTAKPRLLQEYAEKEIFLLFDLQKYSTYAQILKNRLDEQLERTAWMDLQTSTTTAISDTTTTNMEETGNGGGSGNLGVGTGGRFSAQSGQSDRLSYRAAIASTMGPTAPVRASYETNL